MRLIQKNQNLAGEIDFVTIERLIVFSHIVKKGRGAAISKFNHILTWKEARNLGGDITFTGGRRRVVAHIKLRVLAVGRELAQERDDTAFWPAET